MRRGFWFAAGAGAGVYAMVRGRRAAEVFTVDGLKDRLAGLEVGARLLRDEVAQGRVEKETELRERYGRVKVSDSGQKFNTERLETLELGCLIECAEATTKGALERRESRGAQYRTDYEKRDDVNFLAHTLAYRADNGGVKELRYKPVTITKFEPKERKY